MDIVKDYNIECFSDSFQKYAFDISNAAGRNYVCFIIHEVTGITVHSIEKADRVLNRLIEDSKASEFDNHFLVNNQYFINIEVQYERLSAVQLSDKCQFYLGMEIGATMKRGEKYGNMYEYIQIVMFNGNIAKGNKRNEGNRKGVFLYVLQR